jgi:hypothetical protein
MRSCAQGDVVASAAVFALPMQILLIMWIWQAMQKPGSVQQHRQS